MLLLGFRIICISRFFRIQIADGSHFSENWSFKLKFILQTSAIINGKLEKFRRIIGDNWRCSLFPSISVMCECEITAFMWISNDFTWWDSGQYKERRSIKIERKAEWVAKSMRTIPTNPYLCSHLIFYRNWIYEISANAFCGCEKDI